MQSNNTDTSAEQNTVKYFDDICGSLRRRKESEDKKPLS